MQEAGDLWISNFNLSKYNLKKGQLSFKKNQRQNSHKYQLTISKSAKLIFEFEKFKTRFHYSRMSQITFVSVMSLKI